MQKHDNSPVVLVDADSIVYRSGFAAQHVVGVKAILETPLSVIERSFASRQALRDWLAGEGKGFEVIETEEVLELEPVENVLSTVRATIQHIKDYAKSEKLAVYLTAADGVSFRHHIAKQKPYKGNRTKPRPEYYRTIRDYLVNKYGARIITAREADDELSIHAHALAAGNAPYIVVTIDKDLDQIPGEHYNYREQAGYFISEEDAERWFWIQVLAGDATDNVPGCYRVGLAKAAKYVDEWHADDVDIWLEIVTEYKRSMERKGCPYAGIDGFRVALETARLVYLQKRPGELWMPPPHSPAIVEEWLSEDD